MSTKLRCWVMLAVLLAFAPALAAEPAKVLVTFGEAASQATLPPGWNFYWNAKGSPDDVGGYEPLTYHAATGKQGVVDASGALSTDKPSCDKYYTTTVMRGQDGRALSLVASYVLQQDSAGEVWINNGNLRNTFAADGNSLSIYVNDQLKSTEVIAKDRFARVFQKNLGRLKKGDTVRVILAPAEQAKAGGGKFNFILADYPQGSDPGEPVNIVSPAIDTAVPQMGADGEIEKGYLKKHTAQREEMLSKKPELVFLGDSITARWPPELLEARFGAKKPVNLGIGGDWIQNVRWRIEQGVFEQVKPRLVVLLIGTNNISGGFTPEEIISGIKGVVEALNQKSPASKILLVGILPRGESIKNNAAYEKILLINQGYARIADGQKIRFVDVGDKLIEKDGSLSKEMFPDRLHISAKAYPILADALAAYIE
jgi:lysophospholipase L1-like esterase